MTRFILVIMAPVVAASLAATAIAAADYVPGEVLVRFGEEATLSQRLDAVSGTGGEIARQNTRLDYVKIRLPENAVIETTLAFLRSRPGIVWAEPNYYYRTLAPDVPQDPDLKDLPAAPNQWGIFKTGIPSLWRHGGGGEAGVTIAIIDTGIDNFGAPHADLAANVSALGNDLVDDDAVPTDLGASAGHGTHVAGIAGAVSDAAGIAGVAYASTLMIVRVLDCTAGAGCPGTSEDIAEGIDWAVTSGADVINMSLGGPYSALVESAVIDAVTAKVIVVAASGNDGVGAVSFPAGYDPVIAVGATTSGDVVAGFSNWGAALDVVAPGFAIHSTYPGGYMSLNGTSMASPLVAGIAALIRAKNPAMTPLEFQDWIRTRTVDLAGIKDGYGRVDFNRLEDWSDAPGYAPASHVNFMWEWLGGDASSETAMFDPLDSDGRSNYGGSHDRDGYDDGVFPGSSVHLPYKPAHIGAPPGSVTVKESVGRFDGPRYGALPTKSLHLDSWFDWDSDLTFEPPTEHEVADHVENPAGWGSNTKDVVKPVVPPDEHILGNPLVVRTRLAYGASAGAPGAMAVATGEVEDDEMINFVEDFDASIHLINPGIYMTLGGGWTIMADPTAMCLHHGAWEFATTHHPGIGIPCNGVVEATSTMSTPVMNWKEYTDAHLTFWFCHQFNPCSPVPDKCRVVISADGVKTTLMMLPPGGGPVSIDLSAYVGKSAVFIEFVEDTDLAGQIAIDDVVVWAYDDEKPKKIADLALTRAAGDPDLDLTWTAPIENDVTGSPPADRLANTYDARYAATVISSEADWKKATPFVPKDGALPVPGVPGAMDAATEMTVPSALQEYFVAVRTGDEVTCFSTLSNSPGADVPPTPGVSVVALNDTTVAPGETAVLFFDVENIGNLPDGYALSAVGTKPWTIVLSDAYVGLDPGADSVVVALITVPGDASGEIDSITFTATSVTDPTVDALDVGVVTVSGPATSVSASGFLPRVAGLRLVGSNPFSRSTSFELALPDAAHAHAVIYDVSGRRVRTLVNGPVAAGVGEIEWDGRDDRGGEAGPGIYFFELRTDGLTQRERLVLVR